MPQKERDTYIYGASDLIEAVFKAAGMIIIAIGLAILAYAVQCLGVAFAPAALAEPAVEAVEAAAEEETEI